MSRNYLEAFIISVLAAGFGFFLVWPKYIELRDVEQKIAEKNIEIENRNVYYENLEKIYADLDNYRDNLEKIKSAFPDNSDSPALMSFVQSAAMQSGLVLGSVSYNGSKGSAKPSAVGKKESAPVNSGAVKRVLQEYIVSADLIGNYSDFKGFLSRLDNSSRLIKVDKLQVSASDKDEPEGQKKTGGQRDDDPAKKILSYNVSLSVNFYQ